MINSPCVYILKPSFSNKSYIGSTIEFDKRFVRHINELEKGIHHNVLFQEEWNRNTIEEMGVSIINCDTVEAARAMENKLIKKLIHTGCLFNLLNGSSGGDTRTFHPDKDLITAKMVATNTARFARISTEDKKRIWGRSGESNGMYGKTHTPEARLIISEANKGKVSYWQGKNRSEAFKEKLSEIAKLKIGKLNPFFNRKHSDEYKRKASLLKLGKPNLACSKPVSVDGVEYRSLAQASKELNINLTTIRHRALSKNKRYNNYFYVD